MLFKTKKKKKKANQKQTWKCLFLYYTISVDNPAHCTLINTQSGMWPAWQCPHTSRYHTAECGKKKIYIYICAQNTQSQDKQGQQPPSCFPARLMCDFANWLLFTLTKTELENVSLQQPHQAWRAKVRESLRWQRGSKVNVAPCNSRSIHNETNTNVQSLVNLCSENHQLPGPITNSLMVLTDWKPLWSILYMW